jgi:protein-S-isoprenylcysteine O-methyltransferase Ste14
VDITALRLCQIETERHMSLFQPTDSNPKTANNVPAPMIALKGRWTETNFVPAITGVVLALGLSRIGGDVIVQDLHAGATGVFLLLASLTVYFVLNTLWKREETTAFSTTGIFSLSRNPAYLSFFLPLASLAYVDAMTAVAATVIYVLAMNLLVIQKQEHQLQATYGADFTAYRAATPRWFA